MACLSTFDVAGCGCTGCANPSCLIFANLAGTLTRCGICYDGGAAVTFGAPIGPVGAGPFPMAWNPATFQFESNCIATKDTGGADLWFYVTWFPYPFGSGGINGVITVFYSRNACSTFVTFDQCDMSSHVVTTYLDCTGFRVDFNDPLPRCMGNLSLWTHSWSFVANSYPIACPSVIQILGCNNMGVPGAALSVWTDASKTVSLGSTTTNSTGAALFSGLVVPSIYYEVTATGFAFFAKTKTPWLGSDTATLTTAAGYHCLTSCGSPLPGTIHANFSTAGTLAMTYAGGTWTGTGIVSGQSYVISLTTGGSFTLTRNGVSCGATYSLVSCPPAFLGSITIPAGACATELGSTGTITL